MKRVFVLAACLWAVAMDAWGLGTRIYMGKAARLPVESFIGKCARTLDVQLYLIEDDRIVTRLKQAALRGVRVRLLLNPRSLVNRVCAVDLRTAAVEVRWFFEEASTPGMLHSKAACADQRRLLIGSADWTVKGLDLYQEAVVILDEGGAGMEYTRNFSLLWEKAPQKIPQSVFLREELESLPDPRSLYEDEPRIKSRRR